MVGVGFSLPFYYLSKENTTGSNNRGNLILFSLMSYILGSATGVYFVANIENTKISFWETLGYSTIGGTIGFVILNATFDGRDLSPLGIISFWALPTISAMIYSSYVTDWPAENNVVVYQKKPESHKDLIEQSKLFNIELVRIRF